ncbi:MAG: lysine--tRNA ligase [Deltaproteobacteria bacterium]|nr:lysine--tRNA ligase [Deltaproteobacteria bacterium]
MEDNPYFEQRLEKANRLRQMGQEPYASGLKVSHQAAQVLADYQSYSKEELEEKAITVTVAGRMMFVRSFGKAAFVKVQDPSGRVQLYIKKGEVPEEDFNIYQCLEVGDFIWASGKLFRTKTDELSILVQSLKVGTKALRSLPEKFHGLTDKEQRYRQRYVDLIVNPEVRDVFIKRSQIIQKVREFFLERSFLEVETPMMQPIPGGAKAKPFVTHHNALDRDFYLRIAPELYLKRLVVGGLEKVFEINRNFRNEGISIQHNPEFTMLEFYWAYATYEELMDLTEDLIRTLAKEVSGSTQLSYQGSDLDFGHAFRRLSLKDSLIEIAGLKKEEVEEAKSLVKAASRLNFKFKDEKAPLGILQTELFEEKVEAQLIQPTFITQYPTEVSPLSRRHQNDPSVTDRFELFIYGREIANGFNELSDPVDQKERFLKQVEEREAGDEEAMYFDEDFIRALEYGLPPTAGEGIGIDRLVMLLTDQPSIRDVILFPHRRS